MYILLLNRFCTADSCDWRHCVFGLSVHLSHPRAHVISATHWAYFFKYCGKRRWSRMNWGSPTPFPRRNVGAMQLAIIFVLCCGYGQGKIMFLVNTNTTGNVQTSLFCISPNMAGNWNVRSLFNYPVESRLTAKSNHAHWHDNLFPCNSSTIPSASWYESPHFISVRELQGHHDLTKHILTISPANYYNISHMSNRMKWWMGDIFHPNVS